MMMRSSARPLVFSDSFLSTVHPGVWSSVLTPSFVSWTLVTVWAGDGASTDREGDSSGGRTGS